MSEDQRVVEVTNPDGRCQIVLVCEHASNRFPDGFDALGLSNDLQKSHIAWDPGAIEVARHLSVMLDSPLVAQKVSRLLYDCNRPPESAAAIPDKSEFFSIPGNADLGAAERQQRVEQFYNPFRDTLSGLIAARMATQPVIVTIHTFTPVYNNKPRAVEIGILHDRDTSLADRMLDASKTETRFNVQRNQPYGPKDGVTHTLIVQAQDHGLANVMIEIRNDLVTNADAQREMAEWLAGLLRVAVDLDREG